MKTLTRGGTVMLFTADEPSLMMQSLDLQLRNNLTRHVEVEYREENNLFPQWWRAWARQTAVGREEMLARAQTLLEEG